MGWNCFVFYVYEVFMIPVDNFIYTPVRRMACSGLYSFVALTLFCYSLGICFQDHHDDQYGSPRCVQHAHACPHHTHDVEVPFKPGECTIGHEHQQSIFHLHIVEPVLLQKHPDGCALLTQRQSAPHLHQFLFWASSPLTDPSSHICVLPLARYGPGDAHSLSKVNLPLLI